MSLIDLAPANTKRARENASRTFLKFLEDEEVAWDYLETCMKRDNAAQVLEAVVDKFGIYLAFKEGRKGQLLARHSVMQYFRQAKNWLLEQFPQHRALVDKNLLKKGQMLERHCMKRETGAFVKKAPACTKTALKKMMEYLYSTAVTTADYQDAALVALMWFLFGRASDLTMLRKANLSIGSGKIFFVRFIRIKTSEEQGLSLFPDDDFTTCPLLAVAVALATQTAPTISVLSQLPEQTKVSQASLAPSTPLIDLLDHPQVVKPPQDLAGDADDGTSTDATPGVHSYVNRVLDRIAEKAGVVEQLTSHSFRRGGAQHANGAGLRAQWIFDRGAWNMTATNKAFAYVFNTPAEDHQVARVLSGRDPDRELHVLSLDVFDAATQTKIQTIAVALFNASYGLKASQYNVNGTVLDTLMAYLLRHYPSLKKLNANGLPVKRLEACTIQQGYSVNELLAWSSYLTCNTSTKQPTGTNTQEATADITKHPVFLHQAAVIEQLVQLNSSMGSRVSTLEDVVYNKRQKTPATANERSEDPINEPPAKRRRTGAATNLRDVWFTWYAQEPRIWSSTDTSTKHTRSASKQVAAFLKLFLAEGFVLDPKSPQYRDDVLELGTTAEKALLLFLSEHKIKARGAQNVLKSMRKLHKAGHLDARIRRYKQLQVAGRIVDPAPVHTTNIIGLTATT